MQIMQLLDRFIQTKQDFASLLDLLDLLDSGSVNSSQCL